MSTTSSCLKPSLFQIALESLPDYSGVRSRFVQGFEAFIASKIQQAVSQQLRQEIRQESMVNCKAFQQAILDRLGGDCVTEKPYIFLAVSKKSRA